MSGGSYILSQLDVIKAVHFHKADKNREHNYLLNLIPTYWALYSKFIFVSCDDYLFPLLIRLSLNRSIVKSDNEIGKFSY